VKSLLDEGKREDIAMGIGPHTRSMIGVKHLTANIDSAVNLVSHFEHALHSELDELVETRITLGDNILITHTHDKLTGFEVSQGIPRAIGEHGHRGFASNHFPQTAVD